MSPGAALAAPSTPGCNSEPRDQIERYIRVAVATLDATGFPMGVRRMHTLVHRYVEQVAHNGWTFFEFFTNACRFDADQRRRALLNPDVARAISYADPTGETAVNRVMREQGQS
jgi:hypothetical protein